MHRALFVLAAGFLGIAALPTDAQACGPRDPAPEARRTGCLMPPVTTARVRIAITVVEPIDVPLRARRDGLAPTRVFCRIEGDVLSVRRLRGTPVARHIVATTLCPEDGRDAVDRHWRPGDLVVGREITADFFLARQGAPGSLQRPVREQPEPAPEPSLAILQLRVEAIERQPDSRCLISTRIVTVVNSQLQRPLAEGLQVHLAEPCEDGERRASQRSFALGDIAVGRTLHMHLYEAGGALRTDWQRPYIAL